MKHFLILFFAAFLFVPITASRADDETVTMLHRSTIAAPKSDTRSADAIRAKKAREIERKRIHSESIRQAVKGLHR
jgi:hypothetical protein